MENQDNILNSHFLKSILSYNPDTGLFSWKNLSGRKNKTTAGCFDNNGYVIIGIKLPGGKSKKYGAHRLAWLYYHEEWPQNDIDHINGVKSDNRIINLRHVTRRQNQQNRANHRDGCLPGATRHRNKYQAQIQINKKAYYLGYFDTELEAHLAYKLAAKSIGDDQ
jgi:hypothetical protein